MSAAAAVMVPPHRAHSARSKEVFNAILKPSPSHRTLLKELGRVSARVSEWLGSYGWLTLTTVVQHPMLSKHGGRVFVHWRDVQTKAGSLWVNQLVEASLYEDSDGIGAVDVKPLRTCRLALKQEDAAYIFGSGGSLIPTLSARYELTIKAFEWVVGNQRSEQWPYVLVEIVGFTDKIIEALLNHFFIVEEKTKPEGAGAGAGAGIGAGVRDGKPGSDLRASASFVVCESSVQFLKQNYIKNFDSEFQLTTGPLIEYPVRCKGLTIHLPMKRRAQGGSINSKRNKEFLESLLSQMDE